MESHPLVQLGVIALISVFFARWLADLRRARQGHPNPEALAGAEPAPPLAVIAGALGALLVLGLETGGEYALGIVGEQSSMTALFALYTLAAAFAEELIFRGYLVVSGRGRVALWLSVLGFSMLFALLHPFLWHWDSGIRLTPGAKAWFSTVMVFVASLVFYVARFQRWNPRWSLIPCVVAHVVKNAGVVAVKAAQGFVSGWW